VTKNMLLKQFVDSKLTQIGISDSIERRDLQKGSDAGAVLVRR